MLELKSKKEIYHFDLVDKNGEWASVYLKSFIPKISFSDNKIPPNSLEIVIHCSLGNFAYRWYDIGHEVKFIDFLKEAQSDYLLSKFGIKKEIDILGTIKYYIKRVLRNRYEKILTYYDARKLYKILCEALKDNLNEFDFYKIIEEDIALHSFFGENNFDFIRIYPLDSQNFIQNIWPQIIKKIEENSDKCRYIKEKKELIS